MYTWLRYPSIIVIVIASLSLTFMREAYCEVSANLSQIKPSSPSEAELRFRAMAAYVYAYPLVTMDTAKSIMTNTVLPHGNTAPMGQFINLREYPKPSFHEVTAPNADTLYSFAWINLLDEPYVLHVPDEFGRYYLIALISAWTEVFASIGTRTTGTKAQDFVIVGPNWHGKLPPGLPIINSPTDLVWIYGRTYSTGTPKDMKIVHALQDQYSVTPLKFYGKPYTPPKGTFDPKIDMKTDVPTQVNALDAATFFKRFARLMKNNPPTKADQPMVINLAKLGIVSGQDFDIKNVNPDIAKALIASVPWGQKKIMEHLNESGVIKNGWKYMTKTGRYGTDYLQRALVAEIALGANLPEDAIYPVTTVDSSGEKLNGGKLYIIRFVGKEFPPVNGFWSLTMYNDQYFFVPNTLQRYNISQRDKLKTDIYGSVEVYIQHDSPGPDKEANWLPAPEGDFVLMFRLYWPKPAILKGIWIPPGVKKIYKI